MPDVVRHKIYVPTHLTSGVRTILERELEGFTCYPEMEGYWKGGREVVDIYEIIHDETHLPAGRMVFEYLKEKGEESVLYTKEQVDCPEYF